MTRGRRRRQDWIRELSTTAVLAVLSATGGSCGGRVEPTAGNSPSTVLRIGVAQLSATNPMLGLRQLSQILSVEGLARPGEDGRMVPSLADTWTTSNNGQSVIVKLRPLVKFHDGSAFDASVVTSLLPDALRSFMGPVFSEVDHVGALSGDTVEIAFRQASPFFLETLEAQLQKPGSTVVGTGPFAVVPGSTTEMRANAAYYLGAPYINTIHVETYSTVRTAWAEMLRDRLDMLWEVGSDASDSMKNSSTPVFTFTRRYQQILVFNTQAPTLRSPKIRRALNFAVDRAGMVHSALNGYGVASSGPVWPRYWALPQDLHTFNFDPKRAAALLGDLPSRLHFTCLVSPDPLDERVALELKRQLAAIGVDMDVEEVSRDDIVRRAANGQYEAAVTDVISGPSLFRPYMIWHSRGPINWGHFGTAAIDAAFDRVMHAPSEAEYRQAVAGLQDAFMDDPPAIFLAWSVRARAISNRFVVPPPKAGVDVISTLRVWKPAAGSAQASRN
jgi:peptide/nickel transport system substrate-binding protein